MKLTGLVQENVLFYQNNYELIPYNILNFFADKCYIRNSKGSLKQNNHRYYYNNISLHYMASVLVSADG